MTFLSPVLPGHVSVAYAQSGSGWVDQTFGWLLASLMEFIFFLTAWITAQIGYLLDFSVQYFVLEMAQKVDEIDAVEGVWQVFRDLGNIVFIGMILYIAIRTILDVGNSFNTKKLLVRLVIVALFVNFSLFATKVVIDTSNVVALQFYNSIQVEGCESEDCNISHFFAGATNISSVQSAESIEGEAAVQEAKNVNFKIALARFLGTVFLAVTAFVMAAMAFLLIIRFGVLLLLMIASPLAFIAFILPSIDFGNKWVDYLLSQSFFAPALFAMLYVVANLAAGLQGSIAGEGNTNLMAAILSPDGGEQFGVIIVFVLMIILMAATIVVAKQMGAVGASKAVEIGKKARNWGQATIVGGSLRGTFGQLSRRTAEGLKNTKVGNTALGNALLTKPASNLANKDFGSGKSAYKTKKESRERKSRYQGVVRRQEARDEIEEAKKSGNEGDIRRAFSGLSTKQKLGYGKDFLMEYAQYLNESDIKAMEKDDNYTDADIQDIKDRRYGPALDAAKSGNKDKIKSSLSYLSENEIKNNIDVDILNPTNEEERKKRDNLIKTMTSGQLDNYMKNKTKAEKDKIKEIRARKLEEAIGAEMLPPADPNHNPDAVKDLFDDMKDKDMADLLKNADKKLLSKPAITKELNSKIMSEVSGKLKREEMAAIRQQIDQLENTSSYKQVKAAEARYKKARKEWEEAAPGSVAKSTARSNMRRYEVDFESEKTRFGEQEYENITQTSNWFKAQGKSVS